jgi:hypothetical protein
MFNVVHPRWATSTTVVFLLYYSKSPITKYVHCAHTLCPCHSPNSLSISLHSFILVYIALHTFTTYLFSISYFLTLPLFSIPKPLHIYTITIGLSPYQCTQNALRLPTVFLLLRTLVPKLHQLSLLLLCALCSSQNFVPTNIVLCLCLGV